jgi:hypothetical protein
VKTSQWSRATQLSTILVAVAAGLALTAGPAAANDDFHASTTDGCGVINWIDDGDNIVIHDYCSDGHGVEGYAWRNGVYLGKKYNGNGLSGAPVNWDPVGDALNGDLIGIKVCLVDGPNDTSPSTCGTNERTVSE